jgi:hypothetical protein
MLFDIFVSRFEAIGPYGYRLIYIKLAVLSQLVPNRQLTEQWGRKTFQIFWVLPGSRTNRTLLPAAPTGVVIGSRSAGFGNRDRFSFKRQDWIAPGGRISSYRRQDHSASGMPPVAA